MAVKRFAMIPALGFFAFAEYWDAVTSRYYVLHTTGEANWISKNKEGYYSLKKSMTVSIVVAIGFTILAYTLPYPAQYVVAGIVSIISAVILFAIVKNNRKKEKTDKAWQFDYLENFTAVSYMAVRDFKGSWVVPSFYDIRVPIQGPTTGIEGTNERVRAAAELTPIFQKLKEHPELWWDLDRAAKLKALMV